MSERVPDEAVEAACQAYSAMWPMRPAYGPGMREALEAAAPFMQQAEREHRASASCCDVPRMQHLDQNPDMDPDLVSPFEHPYRAAAEREGGAL